MTGKTADQLGLSPAQINARNREIWTPRTDAQKPGGLVDVGGYTPRYLAGGATSYDGIVDHYLRASNFDGLQNGKRGTVATWANTDYNVGALPLLNTNSWVRMSVWQNSGVGTADGGFTFDAYNEAGAKVVELRNFAIDIDQGDFHHFMVAFDTALGLARCRIDGLIVPNTGGGILVPDGIVNYALGGAEGAQPGWNIQVVTDSNRVPLAHGVGCLSESVFHDVFLDINQDAIARRFIGEDGTPVDLGDHGQIPFGSTPRYYSKAGSGLNLGIGGQLAAGGSPSACGSRP